ncbi:iron-containing redox enzyme family protein [Leucobacter chromiiresistens]|uniref:iron-containing redox enzyme family protein n=1 Tax=Leucobacter chromiiresistens TaxID=1079994 RepID=UPI000734415B|nr:iron-containing redox enzyme family protein [Leucobacter chromiiresistens]
MSVTVDTPSPLLALQARGPLSEALLRGFSGSGDTADAPAAARQAVAASSNVTRDDDVQLALFLLYACFYGSLDGIPAEAEWDTALIETRAVLEAAFEAELRDTVPVPEAPEARARDVAKALFDLTSADSGPSLSRYFAKRATEEQAREFLMQKSIYTLREADPHSWAIPRLRGGAKAALVEIQADEYGGGRPDRVHATIYAKTMRGAGLDDTYGAYLDDAPAITLASHNMMSMFGLNRRLVGAIVGHLAAFEMTSAIPNRLYGDGFRRLGYDEEVTDYFDEHVEADAVHEQIAGRDMAGALAEDRPELLADIMFGAAACLTVDGWMGEHMLESWTEGRSSLRAGGAS